MTPRSVIDAVVADLQAAGLTYGGAHQGAKAPGTVSGSFTVLDNGNTDTERLNRSGLMHISVRFIVELTHRIGQKQKARAIQQANADVTRVIRTLMSSTATVKTEGGAMYYEGTTPPADGGGGTHQIRQLAFRAEGYMSLETSDGEA